MGSNNNFFWSQSGILRSWNFSSTINAYFTNRFSFGYNYENEYKLYEKDYYNSSHNFTLGFNTAEWSHALTGFSAGRNFDRDFYLLSAGGKVKLIQNLSVEYTSSYIHFSPDTTGSSTYINIATVNYNFTKDTWIKVFVQNSTSNDKVYVYSLFGWRFKPPFGALYLIYSHDKYALPEGPYNSDSFFIKLTLPISVLK